MAATSANGTRKEKDSIGYKEIPANVYYGIQTARAVENYPISGMHASKSGGTSCTPMRMAKNVEPQTK